MPSTNQSSSPVSVPITIDILTEGGQMVTTHRCALGEGRTDISDYSTTLAVLMQWRWLTPGGISTSVTHPYWLPVLPAMALIPHRKQARLWLHTMKPF